MAQISDFSTAESQVRLLIADLDDTQQVYNDSAIAGAIALADNNNIYRAAAQLLQTMAINEVMIQKRIKILDLSTDGPAQSKELRALADSYTAKADEQEATEAGGAFDWAEQINTPAQWQEFIYKDSLRS